MHNRVTTVALSIAAFIATAGLVIAAAPKRYGSTNNAPIIHTTATKAATTSSVSHLPENPWFGVDVTKNKPAMKLKPRTPRVKKDTISRPTDSSARLVVKFNDDLKLRVLPDGRVMSLTGQDITAVQELLDTNAVILEPMSNLSEERIQSIINRAELHSGKAQPDVGGMFHVIGFERDVDAAARQLLQSDGVEWATFKKLDAYTANLVSIETAQRTAPREQVRAPKQNITDTPMLAAAPFEVSDRADADELFLGNGACCIYEKDNATRTFNPSACIDLLNNADCLAQSDGVTFFAQYQPGRECGVDDNCNDNTFLIGACCIGNGQCLDLFQSDCALFGRFDGGAGFPTLACGNGGLPACNEVTGACCLAGFTCLDLTEDVCALQGAYQGDGTTCASGICDEPPAQIGACCFNDDTGLTVLSSVLPNLSGTFGVFTDDSAPGIGDGQTPYPVGPNNPLVVRNCTIVTSTGNPADENFESAEEACSGQGGQYIGDTTDCSFCPGYGACCQDDECENVDLSTCIDGDLDFQAATDPNFGQGLNLWPTGQNVNGTTWYPFDAVLNPNGRLFAPWYNDFNPGVFQDAILLNVGLMPDPNDIGGPACPPVTANDNFLDMATNNWLAANQAWTGFLGFQNANNNVGWQIPLGDPTSVPAGLLPNGTTIPQVAAEAGQSTWNMACNPGVPLCDLSYCSFWCAGPFSDSQGNSYNACIEEDQPFAPVGCRNNVPRTRCGSNVPPLSPFFCGSSGATGVPTALEPDPGCTNWWNDPEETGLSCFPDAVDNPLTLSDCGTLETSIENQVHGSCFYDRDARLGFPTYCDTYASTGLPLTPWGATYPCYDGPFCDQWACCEDVCAVNPACCEWTGFPGEPNWNSDCANIANAMATGAGQYESARCDRDADNWFPELDGLPATYPPSCGITLGAVNNQCMTPWEDLAELQDDGEPRGGVIQGGCSDLGCCAVVCNSPEGIDAGCALEWGEECVELAKQLCYSTVPVSNLTPNFTPLQFHLKGSDVSVGQAQNFVPVEYQSLISSPFYVHNNEFTDIWQSIDNIALPCLSPDAQQVIPPTRWSGPGLSLEQSNPFSPSTGLRSWGEFMAQISRGNHPAGPNVNGTKGLGVKIAVLDMAAWIQEYINSEGAIQGARHEDLLNIKLEGRDTDHAPVRMIFDPIATRPQRGTGVLGLIGATDNDFGVTGIATEAETYFFPVVDADLGFREMSAWLNAIDTMSSGDIITATYESNYYDVGDDCVSLATDPVTITYIGLALDAGINVIVPAGDGGCNIGDAIATTSIPEIPNCIIVGGALPNPFSQRWWTSNYTETTVGESSTEGGSQTPIAPDLTCATWGGPLVTTGGNLNLTQVAIDTVPDTPGGDPEGYISLDQRRRSYTNDFGNNVQDGGSMAATALTAGTLACTQGFSLQLFGVQMPPFKLVSLPFATGTPKINPLNQNTNSSWLAATTAPPYYVFDNQFESGAPWSPGRLIQAAEMGQAMVTNQNWGLDAAGFITDMKFVRGEQQSGAIASLREIDENYVSGTSEYQSYGWYNPDFYMPGRPYYGAVGEYVDVMIEYTIPGSQPVGNQVDTRVVIAEPPLNCIVELYTWNWSRNKWDYSGLTTSIPGNGDIDNVYESFSANFNDFVNDSGKMYQRVVVFAAGYDGGSGDISTDPPGYLIRLDYIDLGFAPQSGGGGGPDG